MYFIISDFLVVFTTFYSHVALKDLVHLKAEENMLEFFGQSASSPYSMVILSLQNVYEKVSLNLLIISPVMRELSVGSVSFAKTGL